MGTRVVSARAAAAEAPKRPRSEKKALRERKTEDIMRGVPNFETFIDRKRFDRKPPEILQLNIGLYCNQVSESCRAGAPWRLNRASGTDRAAPLSCRARRLAATVTSKVPLRGRR